MLVTILKQTRFNNSPVFPNAEIEVDEQTAGRWILKGVAKGDGSFTEPEKTVKPESTKSKFGKKAKEQVDDNILI